MRGQKPSHTFTKIHLKGLRTNSLHILFTLSFTVFINMFSFAQELPPKKKDIPPKRIKDSTTIKVDSLFNTKEIDSTKQDSVKKTEFLKDIVTYKAKDSVITDIIKQKIFLYNESQINYQDMEITAGVMVIDYGKNLIYAGRMKDSTGYTQKPIFTQGSNVIKPDSIIFNSKNKKAIIFNSVTEQSGGTIISERTKKENDSVFFIGRGKFTTSENIEDPEYYFLMDRAKIVPNKKIVTGFTQMFIYDVPTPIAMPFAFFPMSKKQTSGIIFPSFGEDTGNDRGYFLQNGGYYFAINDYVDLAVLGDYYTNGSYGLRLESTYAARYKFRGNVAFRYENLLNSERGFPDFAQNTIYNIRWSHSQDAKANPNSRFTASVNLGSSQFFQQSINQINQANILTNTLASSVSYSKTFQGEPQVNVNLTASHSQNTNTESVNLTLPTVQASMGRVFPFEPKAGVKKGIIQNINFQLNSRGEYRINTTDSLFGKSEMFDDALAGMRHSIPVSTNFKVFEYFNFGVNANFEETWALNTINRFFDEGTEEVVTVDQNGFDRFLTYNVGASVGTTLYGMYNFEKEGKDPKIQAIRHVIRPSLSYSVTPAFDQYYETYEVIDADGTTTEEFTRFENSLFGRPGNNFSSNVGIAVGNNIEAKVRSKDSTKTESEKVFILNNLNFATSYDMAADSLRWSPLRVTGGTQILNKKMTINFGMTLDPYALDSNNNKINTYNADNGGSLFRMTSANLNLNYTLSNDTFSGKGKDDEEDEEAKRRAATANGRTDDLFGKTQDFADKRLGDKDKSKDNNEENNAFYNYKMPWSLRLVYALNYTNVRRENRVSSNSLMFSGDVELTPRWSFGVSSGYDILDKGVTFTQLRFERDLLSWRMNFTWVPIGNQTSWNFFIGIKSNLLKDIKYDQRRQPDQNLGN
ncbi:putative LPS assembly protein LptD [Winogradskyella sp. UBA3174]|uniref:putative LPS assembly protein LptD n=2 Tax=Winogradskyella TaxID=286104 RepID=UPI0025D25E36|nr:putative LPS assembly protein LptD [Winogradskyella sp. UBA3174]